MINHVDKLCPVDEIVLGTKFIVKIRNILCRYLKKLFKTVVLYEQMLLLTFNYVHSIRKYFD